MSEWPRNDAVAPRIPCDRRGIASAVQTLKRGGVIIFPTDTVYGIGCDPYKEHAVKRIYEIKSRESKKPLPILVDSANTAKKIAIMGSKAAKIAERFWPGSLTMILDITDHILAKSLQLGHGDGIALRVPAQECILEMLKSCKMIAGTSANISGAGSTGDPSVCAESMSGYDMILDGGVISDPVESTILDARGDRISMVRRGKMAGGLEDIIKEAL